MNYGLYLSASGVLTASYRQDVFANNLANVNTVGFKPDLATVAQRPPEAIEDHLGFDLSNELLDQLGGGALAGPQRIDFTPGPLKQTGNPLDVALTDDHSFFVVGANDPLTGESAIRLTRNGVFTRNDEGVLVTTSGGHPVLDANDQPIVLPAGEVSINPRGEVTVNGEAAARIQVARVSDAARPRLFKQGENLLAFTGGDPRTPVENPTIRPGFIENSAVDPIKALTQLIEATKAVTSNGNLIRYHDLLMDRAVNVLGRVA
jgi:flagellar basal body rod protein FlgG